MHYNAFVCYCFHGFSSLFHDHSFPQSSKVRFAFWDYRVEWERGKKKKKKRKKIKHESHTSKPNMRTQMRTDTHIRIQSYMPVFGSSCFWVVKTGAMTTRRPGKRNLIWITAWKYRHLNECNAGSRFPHKQEDLLAFPLRTCHVRRK